jgi:hypothetical protein
MRYSLVILLILVGQIVFADSGWEKPKYFTPHKFDNHTFRDGTKGFKLYYTVKKSAFGGKVPETLDVFVWGPQPTHVNGFIDEEDIPVSIFSERNSWHIIENMDNEDISLVLYFDEPPEEHEKWEEIKIKVVGRYMSPEQRKNTLFIIEISKIKGIVGVGGSNGDKKTDYYIAIADCMPNIRGIVKKARAIAKKYDFTIGEIVLKENYDYLIKEGE